MYSVTDVAFRHFGHIVRMDGNSFHHRTANICNNITCTDMIAAFENSSIIYTPTCKVLIMTGFNFVLHKFMLQSPLKCP